MFKRMLVASDLSGPSDCVIACVKEFKSLGVEEVILFYALRLKYLDSLKYVMRAQVEPALMKQKIASSQEDSTRQLKLSREFLPRK